MHRVLLRLLILLLLLLLCVATLLLLLLLFVVVYLPPGLVLHTRQTAVITVFLIRYQNMLLLADAVRHHILTTRACSSYKASSSNYCLFLLDTKIR